MGISNLIMNLLLLFILSNQIVESVLVINPGYLSKRRGAGTYAKITVLAPDALGDKSPEEEVGHELFRRARVEIKRI